MGVYGRDISSPGIGGVSRGVSAVECVCVCVCSVIWSGRVSEMMAFPQLELPHRIPKEFDFGCKINFRSLFTSVIIPGRAHHLGSEVFYYVNAPRFSWGNPPGWVADVTGGSWCHAIHFWCSGRNASTFQHKGQGHPHPKHHSV